MKNDYVLSSTLKKKSSKSKTKKKSSYSSSSSDWYKYFYGNSNIIKININNNNDESNDMKKLYPKLKHALKKTCNNEFKECITLAQYSKILKKYFDIPNFTYLDRKKIISYKQKKMMSIEADVNILTFVKNGYKTYAIQKIPTKTREFNSFYEFYVGKIFINNYVNKFPCFNETYCLSTPSLTHIYNFNDKNIKQFWNDSCRQSIHNDFGSVVQYYDFTSKMSFLDINNKNTSMKEFLGLCYQIYFALVTLGDKYTNHALLPEITVELYQPFYNNKYNDDFNDNEFIHFKYHTKNKTYEFFSKYVVKIFDYGNCYFKLNDEINTKTILDNYICKLPSCHSAKSNGYDFGFRAWAGIDESCGNKSGYYLFEKNNVSSDLSFIDYFSSFAKIKLPFNLNNDFDKKEIKESGVEKNIANNIYDVKTLLEKYLNLYEDEIDNKKIVAEMNVYDDGRDYTIKIL